MKIDTKMGAKIRIKSQEKQLAFKISLKLRVHSVPFTMSLVTTSKRLLQLNNLLMKQPTS